MGLQRRKMPLIHKTSRPNLGLVSLIVFKVVTDVSVFDDDGMIIITISFPYVMVKLSLKAML